MKNRPEREIAVRLLKPSASRSAIDLVTYLLAAMQLGNLCVQLEPVLYPLLEDFEELTLDGLEEVVKENIFIYSEGKLQLKRYNEMEHSFKKDLHRLYLAKPTVKIDLDLARAKVFKAIDSGELLKEQAQCLLSAFECGLTIITGGPGTGKTYTAGKLLQILLENSDLKIALTAPTGKAARNLQQALSSEQSSIEAMTLHKLLKVKPSKTLHQPLPLFFDMIIVDESSMIDVEMMTGLLKSIRSGTRVVFLGDVNQLPPVEAGALFSNLISLWKAEKRPLCELKRCLRAELVDIVKFSHSINRGEKGALSDAVQKLSWELASFSDVKKVCAFAADEYAYLAYAGVSLADVKRFVLLTPLRRGLFGASSLNQKIYELLVKKFGPEIAVPVLVKSSSKDFGLFNGDIGLLKAGIIHFEGGLKVPPLLIDYEYSFALSVHKSQGSEYDHVFMILPEGAERFGREVLYTGVTRARKKLTLCGSDKIYKELLEKKEHRLSSLEYAPAQFV